jgi:DNA-binding NarL/FixJ family response regulator
LVGVLEDAGFVAVEIDDLEAWVPGRDGSVLVIVARDDAVKDAMRVFCDDHPHMPVVAITADANVGTVGEWLRAGATTVVGEDDPTDHLVTALRAAVSGWTALPVNTARAMAARVPPPADPSEWVSEIELEWLRSLMDGTTVPAIAVEAGYSEREMFRVLQRLYQRLGVGNRTEAIVWATKAGLL